MDILLWFMLRSRVHPSIRRLTFMITRMNGLPILGDAPAYEPNARPAQSRAALFSLWRGRDCKEFTGVHISSPELSVSLDSHQYRDWPGSINSCLPAWPGRASLETAPQFALKGMALIAAQPSAGTVRTRAGLLRPAYIESMSAQREELLRLIEELPDDEVLAVLDDVRRHLSVVRNRPWPPAWFGAGEGRNTDVAARSEDLLGDGFGGPG
jgi:hypothetical protein